MSVDTGHLQADLGKASRSVRGFADETRTGLSQSLSKVSLGPGVGGLGQSLARLAGGFLAFRAIERVGSKIADGIGKAVTASSDLNEQITKTDQVFGESSAKVKADADAMAKAFGVPKREFLDGASSIGLIAKASGLSQSAAADLSTQFARLALDASSFFNVPVDEALTSIRSGLVGESEPMRRFGVLLNEAAVKNEALRLGLTKNANTLTEGQKVQARASLIIKGMADAQGDLARTSGGAANQMRAFSGRLENLFADVGTAIQPVTDKVLGLANTTLSTLMAGFEANRGAIQAWATQAVSAGGSVDEAFRGGIELAGGLVDAAQGIAVAFLRLKATITGVLATILQVANAPGLIGGKLGDTLGILSPAAGAAFDALGLNKSNFGAAAEDMRRLAAEQSAVADSAGGAASWGDRVRGAMAGVADAARKAAGATSGLAGANKQVGDSAAAINPKVVALKDKLAEQIATLGLGAHQAEIYKLKADGVAAADLEGVDALSKQLDGMEAAKKLRDDLQTPQDKIKKDLGDLQGLRDQGLITDDEFARGAAKRLGEAGAGRAPTTNAAALEFGSKEARSAILQARGAAARDPAADAAKTARDQLLENKRTNKILADVARVLGNPTPVATI